MKKGELNNLLFPIPLADSMRYPKAFVYTEVIHSSYSKIFLF